MKTGPKRILFATIGSLGDLHPSLALALELQRRGHIVTVASTPYYRTRVEQFGLTFKPLRPDWDPTSSELVAQCENMRRGPEVLLRKLVLPYIADTYADLLEPARDADFMISGELVHAAPLVAEKLNLPWASAILCPCTFFSAHDPSLLATAPELIHLRNAGVLVNRAILAFSRAMTSPWWRPIRALRKVEGLSPGHNPLFDDKFSPYLVLALFSGQLARPQSDWPSQTIQPGFAFLDRPHSPDPGDEKLRHFLAAGDPPIVFTQGSTAVHHPGDFYKVSIDAVRQMGHRAILIGVDPATVSVSRNVLALKYASYAEVFPHASVVVHQGGSGTTGQAMQAGRPMLFVPFGWDQPDNASRMVRRGSALSLSRQDYTPARAAHALTRLTAEPHFQKHATTIQREMQAENGVLSACNAVEEQLSR